MHDPDPSDFLGRFGGHALAIDLRSVDAYRRPPAPSAADASASGPRLPTVRGIGAGAALGASERLHPDPIKPMPYSDPYIVALNAWAANGRNGPPPKPAAARAAAAARVSVSKPTPTASSASSAPRSPAMPKPDPAREAQRLTRLASRIERLERDLAPRAQTFEERLRSLEEYARQTGDTEKLRELGEIRRAHEAEQRGTPAPSSDARAMDRAMGRVSLSGTGVRVSSDGRSIALGATVEESPAWPRPSKLPPDTRTDDERERDRDAMRRATERGFTSAPARVQAVARSPGDTRTEAERAQDARAMREALGSHSIEHTGTRRTRNGIALGVPVDTTNKPR